VILLTGTEFRLSLYGQVTEFTFVLQTFVIRKCHSAGLGIISEPGFFRWLSS